MKAVSDGGPNGKWRNKWIESPLLAQRDVRPSVRPDPSRVRLRESEMREEKRRGDVALDSGIAELLLLREDVVVDILDRTVAGTKLTIHLGAFLDVFSSAP